MVLGAVGAEPRDLNLDLDLDFEADLPVSVVSRMLLLSLRGEAAVSVSTLSVFLSFLSRSLLGLTRLLGILARDLVTPVASVLASDDLEPDLACPRPRLSCVLRLGTLAWVTLTSVVVTS